MDILRTPLTQDVPRVFLYFKTPQQVYIMGAYAQLLQNFAQRHELDFQWNYVMNYNLSKVQQQIQQGEYNVSVHGATYENSF